jgi:four helix bundle protein
MVFDHERLRVYQDAVAFAAWADELLTGLARKGAVVDQFDRASTSVVLNIAEGNGKFTGPDRCRFFDIARGSALECAACLDVLAAKKRITAAHVQEGKQMLARIVSMLVGMIKSSSDRLYEERAEYRVASATEAAD